MVRTSNPHPLTGRVMMKRNTWIGLGVIVIIAIAIVAIWYGTVREPELPTAPGLTEPGEPRPTPATGEPIKIGAILPLTGDGAKYGEEARNGVDLAVEYENSHGGIHGRPISVVYEDDKGTSKDAVAAIHKLITVDKVPVVIGAMYSSTTLAIAPIAEENHVVLFSPSASTPELTHAGDYVFRNWPSDVFEGAEMARFAYSQLELRKVAILSVNLDYGLGLERVFGKTFKDLGGSVIYSEHYDQGETDFRSQVRKVKEKRPDAVYLPGYYTEIAAFLKQAREAGLEVRAVPEFSRI